MKRRFVVCSMVASLVLLALGAAAHAADQPQPDVTSPSDVALLQSVIVVQQDVKPDDTVLLYGAGTAVHGYVSLDLCAGPFPSERLRLGRLQVAVVPRSDKTTELASTKAILYANAKDASQAMNELRAAAKHCPKRLVRSLVANQPRLEWQFGTPQDSSWPHTSGVRRLAFNVTFRNAQGASAVTHLVYQQRGRVIVGLYGSPTTMRSVLTADGSDEQALAQLVAQRLAALPA